MVLYSYKDYLNIIPDLTNKYVDLVLNYMYEVECIEQGKLDKLDQRIYIAISAYAQLDNRNIGLINYMDIPLKYTNPPKSKAKDSRKEELFHRYYDMFAPLSQDEDYVLLTPEDIINNLLRKSRKIKLNDNQKNQLFAERKDTINQFISDYYHDNYSLLTNNFVNQTAKLFVTLQRNYSELNWNVTIDEFKILSYFLAVYYSNFPERESLIEAFNKSGFSLEKFKPVLNYIDYIDNNMSEEYRIKIILRYFMDIDIDNNFNITDFLFYTIDNNDGRSSFGRIFSKFQQSPTIIDNLYINLLRNIINRFNTQIRETINKLEVILMFLYSKKGILNTNVVKKNDDLIVLAFILLALDTECELGNFLIDNNITLDNVLKILNLPNGDLYKDFISKERVNSNQYILLLKPLLFDGVSNTNPNKDINDIFKNIVMAPGIFDVSIIDRIYNTFNKTSLGKSFLSTHINNHKKKVEYERKLALKEEVFKDIDIEVYQFLQIVFNYYMILKDQVLDQIDREQLSIILAAMKCNKSINNYMESQKLDSRYIIGEFKNVDISFEYKEYPFDIEIVTHIFNKYIFDRDPKAITIYTIFENAFKPSLTNSLKLKEVLYTKNKKPEDFLGIEEKIQAHEEELKLNEQKAMSEELFNCLGDGMNNIVDDVLRIYEYLITSNILNTSEINNKKLAILIAILKNNTDYNRFFSNNHIDLNLLTSYFKIDLEKIPLIGNKILINDFFDCYDRKTGELTTTGLINLLFSEEESIDIIEIFCKSNGIDYKALKYEVVNKKDKILSPEEGISLLKEQSESPIIINSVPSISTYGIEVSKHFKYINEALNELVFNDNLAEALKKINDIMNGIVDVKEKSKILTLITKLLGINTTKNVIRKYNPEKIEDLNTIVDEQMIILYNEVKGYDYIKKYIEAYLLTLDRYLQYLKSYNLESFGTDTEIDEITAFINALDRASAEEIISNKINTFETMITLMKQALTSVHQAIINHIITINSLQISKDAIIPLLTTEMAISIGNASAKEALDITNNLLELLNSVINKNYETASQNILRLKELNFNSDVIDQISRGLLPQNSGDETILKREKND